MQIIYWCGILAYCVVVLIIGWRGFRRTRDQDSAAFWSAGKQLNKWSTGLSISAGFMSVSWSCVYAVQLVYWYGISALWLLAIPWLLTMGFYYILTPHFRKLQAFSQPEMLAKRFGEPIRKYFALPLAFVFLVWGGAELFAAAHILAPILQAPYHLVLTLIAVVVACYSFLGGFSAVVTTDKMQFALVAFFVTTIAWLAMNAVSQTMSLGEALATLDVAAKTSKPALSIFAIAPALIFMTLFAYLPGWVVETDIWLRLQAAKTEQAARGGVVIASLSSVLFIVVTPLVTGLAMLVLYPAVNGVIPAKLDDGAGIFAVLLMEHTPKFLAVLLTVGLAAAAMSTIDTCSNVMAVSLSYDILEPALQKHRPSADLKKVARFVSGFAVVLAYIFALFTESLWDIFYLSSGVLTTTLFIPMMALLGKGGSGAQVRNASVVGFLATISLYFCESRGLLQNLQPDWLQETGLGYIIWAFLLSFLAYVLSALATQKSLSIKGQN